MTYDPAVYLSLEETIGSLGKGNMTDMLMLFKNPVDDIGKTLAIDEVAGA